MDEYVINGDTSKITTNGGISRITKNIADI